MSLTSYRAAPPRAGGGPPGGYGPSGAVGGALGASVLGRVGDRGGFRSGLAVTYSPASWDAVPLAPGRLTAEFGMGSGVSHRLWPPDRIGTPLREHRVGLLALTGDGGPGSRSSAQNLWCMTSERGLGALPRTTLCAGRSPLAVTGSDQANRTISTGQLSASPRVHLRPIDVVVCHGPQGIPGFEGGFPLRCLQRLSCPFIATQHCLGRDNWSTSGTFTPVLSY